MFFDPKKLLVYGTLFVGPAGMFYTPIAALGSFRVFYYGCLAINLYAIVRMRHRHLHELGILIFILALMLTSAAYGLMAFKPEIRSMAQQPIVRALVIGNAMFGFYFLGRMLTELAQERDIVSILDKSFYGFVTVFALGFTLYIGVIQGAVPGSIYSHFVSLEQTGYGYLRLSPGTYPNEFGVLCSFFATYALIKYAYENTAWPLLAAMFFLIGMFLTSTRAAYVTFFAGASTLFFLHPSLRLKGRLLLYAFLGASAIVWGLSLIDFDVLRIVVGGYNAAFNMQEGSTATRRDAWAAALTYFQTIPGFGVGFESPEASFLHNLPLQMLYGLGIWGLLIIILLFGIFFATLDRTVASGVAYQDRWRYRQFRMIRLVLLEHFVLFGLTNHNQAHFLTWFLFAIYICNVRPLAAPRRMQARADGQTSAADNRASPMSRPAPGVS